MKILNLHYTEDKFDTSKTSNLVLVNEPVETQTLKENPLESLAKFTSYES